MAYVCCPISAAHKGVNTLISLFIFGSICPSVYIKWASAVRRTFFPGTMWWISKLAAWFVPIICKNTNPSGPEKINKTSDKLLPQARILRQHSELNNRVFLTNTFGWSFPSLNCAFDAFVHCMHIRARESESQFTHGQNYRRPILKCYVHDPKFVHGFCTPLQGARVYRICPKWFSQLSSQLQILSERLNTSYTLRFQIEKMEKIHRFLETTNKRVKALFYLCKRK